MKFGSNTCFSGSIYEIGSISKDEVETILEKYMNDYEPNNKFIQALIDGYVIDDIATVINLPEQTVHSWLSDIIPTIFIEKKKMDNKNNEHELFEEIQEETVGETTCYFNATKRSQNVFDIYEYAKEMNADYYDFNSGYTYHVQDYNRAKKLGLPTSGIAVSCHGEFLGYAQKLN